MTAQNVISRIVTVFLLITLPLAGLMLQAPTSTAYKKEATPGIDFIADAPWQVTDPLGGNLFLPLLAQIMGCDQIPIFLISITVSDGTDGNPSTQRDYEETINSHIWYDFFTNINFADYDVIDNQIQIHIVFSYRIPPFQTPLTEARDVYVELRSADLPTFNQFYRLSTHTHSSFTDDMYEFGPILDTTGDSAYSAAADAQGINFVAITDHSYDVTQAEWTDFITAVNAANTIYTSQLIVGQEISCYNKENDYHNDGTDAGHLLTYNASRIDTGQGMNKASRPDYNESWVLSALQNESSHNIAYIAHPFDSYLVGDVYEGWEWNFSESVMGSNRWNTIDTWFDGGNPDNDKVLRGLEIWNYGCSENANAQAREKWIELLDNGIVAFALGGTDSHNMGNGDTTTGGIYGTPAHFGAVSTLVYSNAATPGVDDIINGLREGRMIVSDGPLVNLKVNNAYMIGDRVSGSSFTIDIDYATTADFGDFTKITIYLNRIDGDPNSREWKHEIVSGIGGTSGTLSDLSINSIFDPDHSFSRSFGNYYIRVEGETVAGNVIHRSFTNPIWLDKSAIGGGGGNNLPDLIVESIYIPPVLPGTVSATILNKGPSFAYSDGQFTNPDPDFHGFYVTFYDSDYSVGEGWSLMVVTPLHVNRALQPPPHVLNRDFVYGLDSGERITVYAEWTQPPYGTNEIEVLWVYVDWYDTIQEEQQFETERSNLVLEFDETNNLLYQVAPQSPP